MIRVAFRMVFSGRGAWLTQIITTCAVAFGSALFIFAFSVAPAMQARADRTGWMSVTAQPLSATAPTTTVSASQDNYGRTDIDVVLLAGNSPSAPVPPGLTRLPGVDEVFASPAAQRLISAHPELADRYGHIVGTIGNSGLAGPQDVVFVRGVSSPTAALTGTPVTQFPDHTPVPGLQGLLRLLLLLGAVATLTPIALFVIMATRLTAASRDERLARLRLAGADTTIVRRLAVAESLVPGVFGVLTGAVLFFLARPLLARLDYDGGRWFVQDLNPGILRLGLILVCVPVCAALVAQATLGAVMNSPLHSSARGSGRAVRAWRVIPLLLALPALIWVLGTNTSGNRDVMVVFAVLLATLVLAGPWFTRIIGLAMVRSGGPAQLLAGRRLTSDPRDGFRSVSGVILAVLLTTLFVSSTPSAVATLQTTRTIGQQLGTLQADVATASTQHSQELLADVRAVPGIESATLTYQGLVAVPNGPANVWIGDCRQIAAATRLQSIPCGSAPVIVARNFAGSISVNKPLQLYSLFPATVRAKDAISRTSDVTSTNLQVSRTALMPAQEGVDMPGLLIEPSLTAGLPAKLRPSRLLLAYKNPAALEKARSLIIRSLPSATATTRENSVDGYNQGVRRYYWILTAGTILVFALSTAGLIIAMLVGMVERQRPLSLLRAAGAAVPMLRRMVFLEAVAPLATMSLISAALGIWLGTAITRSSTASAIPWAALALPLSVGLIITVIVVGISTSMVRRLTGVTRVRFE